MPAIARTKAHLLAQALAHAPLARAPGRTDAERAHALEVALERACAAPGWAPGAGVPHPTGGYERVEVLHDPHTARRTSVRVVFRNDHGRSHRVDGPAEVAYDGRGVAREVSWFEHGQAHRADGPSQACGRRISFHHRGRWLCPTGREAAARYLELLGAGAPPDAATQWLVYDDEVSRMAGRQPPSTWLLAQGCSPHRALAAVRAGVVEPRALVAAATSRAPVSWVRS